MRHPVVSRGVKYTNMRCLVINVQTRESGYKVFQVRGIYKITKRALRIVKEKYDTDDVKIVTIESVEVITKMYGMTMEEFLSYAHPMDDTRHIIHDNKDN